MSETKEPHVAGAPPDDTPAAVHTDPVPAADASVQTEPEVKRKRGRPRKTAPPENESGSDGQNENPNPPNVTISGDQRVLSIDGRLRVATEADKAKNDLLDLMESLRSKRILTGMIQGVEGNPDAEPRAVVYHEFRDALYMAAAFIPEPLFKEFESYRSTCQVQFNRFCNAKYYEEEFRIQEGEESAGKYDAMITQKQDQLIKLLRKHLEEYRLKING